MKRYDLLKEIEKSQAEIESRKEITIRCIKCFEPLYRVRRCDLSAPIRAEVFKRRDGCEHWDLPKGDDPRRFLCPHGYGGDNHSFLGITGAPQIEAVTVRLMDGSELTIPYYRPCPCGCGEMVKPGREYAGRACALRLYRKERGKGHQEDGIPAT